MQARLDQLPLEILLDIVPHLDNQSISRTALTCGALRHRLTHALYRHVRFHFNSAGMKHPRIWRLLRTLLGEPRLAEQIEGLDFRGYEPRYSETSVTQRGQPTQLLQDMDLSKSQAWTPSNVHFTPRDQERARAVAAAYEDGPGGSAVHLTGSDCDRDGIEIGSDDVGLVLLLATAPRLRRLRISFEYCVFPVFINLIRQAVLTGRCLQELTHVETHHDLQGRNDITLNVLSQNILHPLLALPKLQRLSTYTSNDAQNWKPSIGTLDERGIQTIPLTALVLHHTQIYEEDLIPVFKAAPNLKVLGYHPFFDLSGLAKPGRRERDFFDLDRFGEALGHARAIEHLAISYQLTFAQLPVNEWPLGVNGDITGLKELQRLKSLVIPWRLLMGLPSRYRALPRLEDLLPASLTSLTVADDFYTQLSMFREATLGEWRDGMMHSALAEWMPVLASSGRASHLALHVFRKEGSWDEEAREQLQQAAATAGVGSCVVVRHRPPMKWVGCGSGQLFQYLPSLRDTAC